MDFKEIYNKLKALPSDKASNYSEQLKIAALEIEEDSIDVNCIPILNNENEDDNLKFNLYYSLTTSLRRKQSFTKFCDIVSKYGNRFKNHPLSYVTLSLYYKYIAEINKQNGYYKSAIDNAYKAIELLPENLGVYNNYAELVISAYENGYVLNNNEIDKSIEFIDMIMLQKVYPKWHYTKSRLLFISKKYDEAKENIKRAIDLEDANGKDSLLRISEYNNFLLNIRTSETLDTINEKIEKAKNEINEINTGQEAKSKKMLDELDAVKSKYLEFLAFFASIIAFITASINIVNTYKNVYDAGSLIIVFSGCQTLAFCLFRLLISYNSSGKKYLQNVISILFAISIIVAGFFVASIFGNR